MNVWTVKQKLICLILAVVTGFGLLTVFLLTRNAAGVNDLETLYQKDFRGTSVVAEIDGLLTRVDINILRMVAIGDPASVAKWSAQNNEGFGKVDKLLADAPGLVDAESQAELKTLGAAYDRMRQGMSKQVQAIERGDMKAAGDINRSDVKDNADQTFASLSKLKAALDKSANARVQARLDSAGQTRLISIVAALLAAVGSLLLGALMVRNLLSQLGGEPSVAAEAVRQMAAGNLATALPLRAGDSRSLMAQLQQMQSQLSAMVNGVRHNAESVATASAQIAQGNADLSQRTETQASALQETAATMDELAVTVRNNAESAQQANQLALGASGVATRGGSVVGEVVETMKGINQSSKRIGDIISVIDGIAFQTNILALNAAVEAARAGEQGRGFAVVAGEVRSLAQRSADAAKEIKSLISASVEQVEQGTQLVDQAGQTMTEIVGSIRRVSDIVGEISAASAEQSSGVGQVGQAVAQMDQATQQNAALVEQSAAAAESLKSQAHALVQTVSVFSLGATARH